MEIQFNGKSLDLSFGFKALSLIDKRLGMEIEQMSIGQGLSLLVPNLAQGNPITIGEVILSATAHHKKSPKEDDLDDILDEIAENQGFQEFGEVIIKELGKRPTTRNLVPDEYKPKSKKEK
ncbi:tail assembly chaperone [Staphylococcus pseudoxylosus]|uniref:tail assembly chaperone n=1 Tax=Staphylococcus pseudoxylosus TaxID=2282419 RepID=UPI002DBD16EF|nr:tail assembly chaperone [Staphylococcus pseudoxylosus]MEB6060849.1 tail assembly chaperone [Staphylococcus pseudoxylosus]